MNITIKRNLHKRIKLLSKELDYTLSDTVNHLLAIQLALLALPLEERKIVFDIYDKALDNEY